MENYIKFAIQGVLPALLTIVFLLLEKTAFAKVNKNIKQVIYGIGFGLLAVLGTEFGVQITGAVINARDAAVITAGLLFGSPAGILAGLIGGIERYFAPYWGVGAYTQIACSVSTTLAGFYSAALRKYMFEDSKPSWLMAFAIGLVMETFHIVMVFITHIDDTYRAMAVVKACAAIMILGNAISVMVASFFDKMMDFSKTDDDEQETIAETIQKWMLVTVVIAFTVTSWFMYQLESAISDEQIKSYLTQGINDVKADVEESSDRNLIELSRNIANEIGVLTLDQIRTKYDVAEINITNDQGIIIDSTNPDFIGFDFSSGEQSAEFLCLLEDTTEYVQPYGPISYDQSIYRKYAGVKTDTGFIQVGYDALHFQNDLSKEVAGVTRNRHIGTDGYIFIADQKGIVVSSPDSRTEPSIYDYKVDPKSEEDTVLNGVIGDVDSYYMLEKAEGYTIVSVYPVDEADHTKNVALYANTFMEILVFAVLFALIYLLIKFVVVDNMKKINKSLTKITEGDLNEKVNARDIQEFSVLSGYINGTVDKLKQYIDDAKKRIEAELENAKNIQHSALPHTFPESDRYELFALMDAAKEVGGDFYDFFRTSKDTLNFLVADVSGKGIPGAMFMMRAKSELHSLTETGVEVNEVFTYGNNSLCENNDAGMFVTAWEGKIDLNTGLVQYANAGHNPPVIIRTDGTIEYVRGKAGFVLAGMEGINFKMQELQMQPGDILFLYTDGVVEATNINNELYGEDRLIKCLEEADKAYGMEYLCCEVIGDVGRFVGEAEQFDDITMMALMYKGPWEDKPETDPEDN